MFEPHQGDVRLINDFDKIWESLNRKGELSLQTEKKGKPFIVKATVAGKGQHSGERVILFLQEKNGKRFESARIYECCWSHYYNCYGTRIGMYCETLDRHFRIS